MRGPRWIFGLWLATGVALSSANAQAPPSDGAKDSVKTSVHDTLPFHKGQWAAQFVAGTQFVSAGVLHFRSRTSAWLLDGSVSYAHTTRHGNAVIDTLFVPVTITDWSAAATFRLGIRTYKPLGNATQWFTTYGLLLQGGGGQSTVAGQEADSWSWGAGVFGELGANYMITPHIGLGAAAGVQAAYRQSGSTPKADDATISVSGALLSLQLGIYF